MNVCAGQAQGLKLTAGSVSRVHTVALHTLSVDDFYVNQMRVSDNLVSAGSRVGKNILCRVFRETKSLKIVIQYLRLMCCLIAGQVVFFGIMKNVIIILAFLISSISTYGQNCSVISGTKDKKNGTESIGGITNSKDFYSLLIRKTLNRTDNSLRPIYTIDFVAASRILLTDSLLDTKGTYEFLLQDNSILTIGDVTYKNNPLGYCCALGFNAEVTEEQIRKIAQNPIVTLKVKEIKLTTDFAPKKQKEQQTICNCLLNR
jgi:hypothetical protein